MKQKKRFSGKMPLYIVSWFDQDGTRWYHSFDSLSDREAFVEEVVMEVACGEVGFFTLHAKEVYDEVVKGDDQEVAEAAEADS